MKLSLLAPLVLVVAWAGFLAGQTPIAKPELIQVPRAFGQFRCVYGDILLFEDEKGTLRGVYAKDGRVIYTVNRR
jgi:hypothetical protein